MMTTIETFENISVDEEGVARTSFTPDGNTPLGIHKIKGTYNRNDVYNESVSELQNFIVNMPTATSISNVIGNTGDSINLVANVTCSGFTVNEGFVQFKVAGTVVGTANVSNGSATLAYTVACVDQSTLQAIYMGVDGKYATSTSSMAAITVRKDSNIFINNIILNANESLNHSGTATYTDSSQTVNITGTGEFFIDNVKYGNITITDGAFTLSGQLPSYTPGSRTCKVTIDETNTYEGDEYTFTITVRHSTTVTVADTPASKGETITLTANVKDESNNIVTEGTVEWTIDGTTSTTSVVNGVATKSFEVPSNQSSSIAFSAQFQQSTNYSGSSSASANITIREDVTITVESKTVTVGDSVYLVAHVVDSSNNPVTTGTVDFEILESTPNP